MAMALGLDYWIVPGISAFFLGQYEMTPEGAAAVVRLVRHILHVKNLSQNIIEDLTQQMQRSVDYATVCGLVFHFLYQNITFL